MSGRIQVLKPGVQSQLQDLGRFGFQDLGVPVCGAMDEWAHRLANVLAGERMGFFMGVFNYFIVLPQILASTLMGPLVARLFNGAAMPVVMTGGASLVLAAILLVVLVPATEVEQGASA